MGYVLEGGPRDGEYADEVPDGYAAKGITAGVVSGPYESPTPRATWLGSPKERYAQQLAEEEYESYGEGARRELFGD